MNTQTKNLDALDSILKITPVNYLNKARALKWAGGKRTLIPDIMKVLPSHFNDYYEPFLGGGSVFFALDSRIKKAHLSDLNQELILTYQVLKKYPQELINELKSHKRKHDKEYYLKVRAKHKLQEPIKVAGRFIYLNKIVLMDSIELISRESSMFQWGDIQTHPSVMKIIY